MYFVVFIFGAIVGYISWHLVEQAMPSCPFNCDNCFDILIKKHEFNANK